MKPRIVLYFESSLMEMFNAIAYKRTYQLIFMVAMGQNNTNPTSYLLFANKC